MRPLALVEPRDTSLKRWCEMVSIAIARIGWSRKQTAAELGVSESMFSRCLQYDGDAIRDHLSFWRMSRLPPEFWREMLTLICEYHDLVVTPTVAIKPRNGDPHQMELIVAETPQDRLDAQLGKLLRDVLGEAARRPLAEGSM